MTISLKPVSIAIIIGMAGVAFFSLWANIVGKPAKAQGFGTGLSSEGLNIGVTTLTLRDGTQASHAYAIDPRAGVVLFCQTPAQAVRPECTAVPIPGTAQR